MNRELIVMKRSNKEPQDGDVFVVQPKKELCYYGKVIRAKLESKSRSFNGWYLIFFYDICTRQKNTDIDLEGTPLLIAPMVVNKRPWTMGYLETIRKSLVTDYDRSIDFGFWDHLREKYYDIQEDFPNSCQGFF